MTDIDRLEEIADHLRQYLAGRDIDCVYWVDGADGADDCQNRCRQCVETMIEARPRPWPKHAGVSLGGYNPGHTIDGSPFCCDCGEPVTAALSECALDGEVEHFADAEFGSPLSIHDAHAVDLMVNAATFLGDDLAELRADVLKIAEAAMRSLPIAA